MSRILVIGGDGFCGWPTSLRLLAEGHEVIIIDNLSRRKIDIDLGSSSITPIATIENRVEVARSSISRNITFENVNIATEYDRLVKVIKNNVIDTIVHFGEQRAAPFSMKSEVERRYTVDNNIVGTHNVLNAIVEVDPNIHLVHLGTMGVYGYSKEFGEIPEGYLDVTVNSTKQSTEILYPTNPGSVYHMTKSMDQLLFQFYNKNWGIAITDLHQGIVWGTQTNETKLHPDLVNRFDYDGFYGTVLNRFLMQAANGFPLSVYGTGGQTRAFIHIQDTAKCIQIAIENQPKEKQKVRIFNQVAETHTVEDLAKLISKKTGASISYLENPRKELSKNDLEVANHGLVSLGFSPTLLSDTLLEDVLTISSVKDGTFLIRNINNSPKW